MKVLLIGTMLVMWACAPGSDSPAEPQAFTDEDGREMRAAVLGSAEPPLVVASEPAGSNISILRERIDQFEGGDPDRRSNQEILRRRIDEFGR